MVGVAVLQSQDDPSLHPGVMGVLAYLVGVLLLSGGLAQATAGYDPSTEVWGLTGRPVILLGVLGLFLGFVALILGVYARYRPTAGIGRGTAILGIAIVGLLTSLWGFFLIGTVLGIVLGSLVIRQGISPARNSPQDHPHGALISESLGVTGPQVPLPAPTPMKRPEGTQHRTYAVFFLLGSGYVLLGALFWIHDRSSFDLLFVGIGGFIVLISVGFHLAVTRFFPVPSE
jgi:hypothetical protein